MNRRQWRNEIVACAARAEFGWEPGTLRFKAETVLSHPGRLPWARIVAWTDGSTTDVFVNNRYYTTIINTASKLMK